METKIQTKKFILKIVFSVLAFAFVWNFVTPNMAAAVALPCTPSEVTKDNPTGYQNDVFNCVNSLYLWALVASSIAAVFMIILGGYLYIFSGGSESRVGTAKSFISTSLLGIAVLVAGFLVLQQINPSILKVKNIAPQQIGQQAWFDVIIPGDIGGGGSAGGAGGSRGPGSGTCTPVPSGIASVASLSQTCFGANAQMASSIANKESNGNPSLPSGSDICRDGSVASWGLFQINLSAHRIIDASGKEIDCTKAFHGRLTSDELKKPQGQRDCWVIDRTLYNQCKAIALDPNLNIKHACRISNNGANWGQWGANSTCKFPK